MTSITQDRRAAIKHLSVLELPTIVGFARFTEQVVGFGPLPEWAGLVAWRPAVAHQGNNDLMASNEDPMTDALPIRGTKPCL